MSADGRISVRLTEDLMMMLTNDAKQHGLSPSDIVREALSQYYYGATGSTLSGIDAGYESARRLAKQLALAAVTIGLEQMPEDPVEGREWIRAVQTRKGSTSR